MNAQQQRDLRAFDVSNRIGEQAMHFSSIFALEADRLSLAQLQLSEQSIVLMRKLSELQFIADELRGIDLAGTIVVTRDCDSALARAVSLTKHNSFVSNQGRAA